MQIKEKIKQIIKKIYYKKGLNTNRKIIVFESDDWGAERNFSKRSLEILLKKRPSFTPDWYQSFDILETDEDIIQLKEVLLKHKDKNKRPAIFTLNFAVNNLDYNYIKEQNYRDYRLVTIGRYYKEKKNCNNVLREVFAGVNEGCFIPQLHAREHINTEELFKDIESGNQLVIDSLKLKIVGVKDSLYCGMDCLNVSDEISEKIIKEAAGEFKSIFGQESESFIAPCYVWKFKDEKILEEQGIKFLQGKLFQNIPCKSGKYRRKFHKFGEKSKFSNLRYFYRNCFFEPTKNRLMGKDNDQIVNDIISQIRFAFSCNKPAVICTHRVNYVGGIAEENRKDNLKLLDILLERVQREFSDVEFMSTSEMCKEILKENDQLSKD